MSKESIYHESVFYNGASYWIGKYREAETSVTQYIHLSQVNDSLLAENARLQSSLLSARRFDTAQVISINDSVGLQQYKYIGANLIRVSLNAKQNKFTINRGSLTGVRKDDAVITQHGIVGKVAAVSEHFATIVPVININYKFPARLKRSNHLASMTWDGEDYRYGILVDLPGYETVKKGDTIVADYYSSYPSGYPIGVVVSYAQGGQEGNFTVKVKLFEDLSKTRYVYVIRDMLKDEQGKVEAIEPKKTP